MTSFKIPSGIECPDWEPLPDRIDPKTGNCSSKLCRFYLSPNKEDKSPRGLCQLPSRFSCQEWDRANPGLVPQPTPPANATQTPVDASRRGQTSLHVYGVSEASEGSGAPGEASGKPKASKGPREVPYRALPEEPGPDILVSITAEQISQLKKSGIEIEIRSKEPTIGSFWLVPAKTGKDRMELTFEEAATVRMISDAFPGARVVGLRKSKDIYEDLEVNSDDLQE